MTESSQPDGTRLRLARQARGLSQQQLAGVAGVTRQAVSAVESGHSDPSLRVALGLARALGMTVEELFGPGEPGDPVLARPIAPVSAPGSRVALATVGDTFVALPLDADLAARLGFGAAGGLTVRGGGTQGTRALDCVGTPSLDGHRLCIARRWAGLTMSVVRGRPECAGRPARSRWCKSITMKE